MIITNLVPSLGWTLLHSLWQGGLLFLIVAPLLAALKSSSPKLRYGVVSGALLVLVAAMATTFTTYLDFGVSLTGQALTALTETGVEEIGTDMKALGEEVSIATTEAMVSAPAATTFSWSSFLEENVNYLAAFWAIGAIFFSFRWFSMLYLTTHLRKRGVQRLASVWHERLMFLSARMQVTRKVDVVESDQVDTPLVIGYLKPIILLPIGLINGLSVTQVEAILAHELAHINRRDFLINLLFTGLEVVLFYHPFYWWVMSRINEEREKCCDDIAVATCGNPRMYAHTLLSVEEHRQSGVLAMAFSKEGGQLQQRIKRICKVSSGHHQSISLRFWLMIPLLGFVAAFTYAGVNPDRRVAEDIFQREIINPEDALVDPMETTDLSIQYGKEKRESKPTSAALAPSDLIVAEAENETLEHADNQAVSKLLKQEFQVNISSGVDSLPKPVIPRLRQTPTMPEPPVFQLSEEEIGTLMSRGDEGRKELRAATATYRSQIDDWHTLVNNQYLEAWSGYREEIMEAYGSWKAELRNQSGDELAFALAHEEMIKAYEDAFERNEDALEEVEDVIEEQPEHNSEGIEKVIERKEESVKDHSDRMQIHSIRMGMHSVRMKIHTSRMKVHSSRMRMHSARMLLHGQRMESHKIIMAALEAELREALMVDGLLEKGEEKFSLKVTSSSITFNRKTIKPQTLEDKYRTILAKYGKANFNGNMGNTFTIEIDGKGRKMERK